jgi:hypothetical protein
VRISLETIQQRHSANLSLNAQRPAFLALFPGERCSGADFIRASFIRT